MTNEEAIKIIKSECYIFNPLDFDKTIMINSALDMAVKALKQEPKTDMLDKIRAEIESIEITCDSSLSGDKRTDAEKCKDWVKLHSLIVLQIIDKYKAESEVQE